MVAATRRGTDWRIEADDAWLAAHSSDTLARLCRRLPWLAGLAGAVSHADTGPFAGAPRNPRLTIGGRAYAFPRDAGRQFAYTAVRVAEPARCPRCDRPLAELHRIVDAREDGAAEAVGAVIGCRGCAGDSWLFRSRMPQTFRARAASRKTVL